MARLVEDASRKVALERDQLGALMAELHQSVSSATSTAASCSTTAAPAPSSAASRAPPTAPAAPS